MRAVTIIGIDPGSQRTGWGIVRETSGMLQLVDCGVIRCQREAEKSFSARLAFIYRELCSILGRHTPDGAAIENIFTAQNAASSLKLGQARGVAVAACAAFELAIYDYEPRLVKKSLVGNGAAEKEQVAFMTRRLLNVRGDGWALDTTDALAVAICHLSQRRFYELAGRISAPRAAG